MVRQQLVKFQRQLSGQENTERQHALMFTFLLLTISIGIAALFGIYSAAIHYPRLLLVVSSVLFLVVSFTWLSYMRVSNRK